MTRPSHADTIFDGLEVTARRSTCPRLHTAAAIVTVDFVVVATGYNGSVRGLPHCDEVGCLIVDGHCKRTIHAELNTIINAARERAGTQYRVMYSLHTPCMDCAKYIIQSGITSVFVRHYYDNNPAVDFLKDSGIYVA